MTKRHRNVLGSWQVAVLVAWLAGAQTAHAHKLRLFATAEGRTIGGYAYFVGGGRPRDVTVAVHNPAGERLGETRTNDQGEFRFTAATRCDHVLTVDAGDGHGASFIVKADELPDDLPAWSGAAAPDARADGPPADAHEAVARAVARQVRPLREQLDHLEQTLRVRDILGGLGYIAGVTGLALYVAARRRAAGAIQADRQRES